MKLRIVEPGWEGYTGPMSGVLFENGLSTRDVTQFEVERISASIRTESESGEDVSLANELIKAKGRVAEVVPEPVRGAAESKNDSVEAAQEPQTKVETRIWTQEDLELLADTKGIAGVREVADGYGIKSKSIAELISGILKAQNGGTVGE